MSGARREWRMLIFLRPWSFRFRSVLTSRGLRAGGERPEEALAAATRAHRGATAA